MFLYHEEASVTPFPLQDPVHALLAKLHQLCQLQLGVGREGGTGQRRTNQRDSQTQDGGRNGGNLPLNPMLLPAPESLTWIFCILYSTQCVYFLFHKTAVPWFFMPVPYSEANVYFHNMFITVVTSLHSSCFLSDALSTWPSATIFSCLTLTFSILQEHKISALGYRDFGETRKMCALEHESLYNLDCISLE